MRAIIVLLMAVGSRVDAAPCARLPEYPRTLPFVACPTSAHVLPCLRCLDGQTSFSITYDAPASAVAAAWARALDADGWVVVRARPRSLDDEPPLTARRGDASISVAVRATPAHGTALYVQMFARR